MVAALAFCLIGCGSSEPIVGKWASQHSNAKYEFKDDGTFSYTNRYVTELGYLTGSWEKCESKPTVNAEGKEWHVYIEIPADRTIEGDGSLGNKYKYNDKYGDYLVLVSGDESVTIIGYPNLESVEKDGKISSTYKETTSAKRV